MGLQLSLGKKDKSPKYDPRQDYPPYPGMPAPYGSYWPGAGYGPVPMMPANYNIPGFIPPALPWPTNQTTQKRKRKGATKSGGRRKRSNTDTMTNLPVGFVPNGFIPRGEDPTRMPQPVVPAPIGRAISQGQPPPLFTPGNNAQQLAIFSSPQIPAPRTASGSSHGHGSNLRAPTPFIRSRQTDDDDDEEEEEEDDSDDDRPVIPSMLDQRGHRRAATMPAMQLQIQPYMPQRRHNPLPQPPRSFDRTPFKRLADLPHLEIPTQTTIVQMVQPDAGLAGIGANGATGTQPKKSRLLRALSLRGNKQSDPSKSGTAAGPAVPITRIVPVIVSSQNIAGPSSAGANGVPHNLANPPRPANTGNLTHSTSPNLSTQSSPEPPLLFKTRGPYRAFVPFSEHPVTYQGKEYPTAQHLFEAKRFPENQQESWELIRTSRTVNEVYDNASKLCQRGLERPDWSMIFLREMEEVLYLKLIQHESIRSLLLRTGNVPLVYCANDQYWGNGEDEHGANKLGEVLQRVRDRLRADGYA